MFKTRHSGSAFCESIPSTVSEAERAELRAHLKKFRFPRTSPSVSTTNRINRKQSPEGHSTKMGERSTAHDGTLPDVDIADPQDNLATGFGGPDDGDRFSRANMSPELGLRPDPCMFHYMFRYHLSVESIKRLRHKVLSSSLDKCTFIVYVDDDQSPTGYPTQMLGRIEKPKKGNPLFGTAAFQKLARRRLPHLVPKVWGVGKTRTMGGGEVHYLLSQHHTNVTTVADIWDSLNEPAQGAVLRQVTKAMSSLQDVRIGQGQRGKRDWEILRELPISDEPIDQNLPLFGGPRVGFFQNIHAFLHDRLRSINDPYDLYNDRDGCVILQTRYPGRPAAEQQRVNFTSENLRLLQDATVICHDDLEPRNILVRMTPGALNSPGFKLVAIINWDSACFAPFASEAACKDVNLGLRNKSATWYENWKYATGKLFDKYPDRESQEKLARALHIADHCLAMSPWLESEVRLQKMWLERERLEMGVSSLDGYVRRPVEDLDELEFKTLGILEDEVLVEEARNQLSFI
ncbi:hypothetical protein CMUS01_07296 [Colletotrichum musicola]|uniref:Aminoglycoside phosphotransferase domain-containing protein n=1 Tax=Colletotrichum musicola TaxID=2175873 RepID=A0A8H6NGB6_9PEZI|nr:hypothetical protein CMUS01_07296 [Colletotrichum musicola]